MALINCSECGAEVSANAAACPKCGNPIAAARVMPATAAPKKQEASLGVRIVRTTLVVIIGIAALALWVSHETAGAPGSSDVASSSVPVADAATREPMTAPAAPPIAVSAQDNAVRSAKQYLSMQGFSRKGLIHQLSSDAGEGYEIADATAAVDSLSVDWNQQAARSAKQYLSMQGFSCKGLVHQLSSDAGEGYTVDQAIYGAKQAGAC